MLFEAFPEAVDVPSPHGDHQITLLTLGGHLGGELVESGGDCDRQVGCQLPQRRGHGGAGDAWNRRFTSGVEGRDQHGIGCREGRCKAFQKLGCAAVAMGLKHCH